MVFPSRERFSLETPLYRVRVDRQGAVQLSLELHDLGDVPELFLEVPTWVAGAYAFLRYGRDLYALAAMGGDGTPLAIERDGLSRFRILAPAGGTLSTVFFSATVQARDASWGELAGILRDDGGILLPTAFPVPVEWRGPVDVVVDVGDGRQLLVAGVEEKTGDPRVRRFASFEAWLDTPMVVGEPTVIVRQVRGCRFEHVFCQEAIGFEAEVEGFVDELVRIAEACHDLFGSFPFERYTWIISFDPRDHWGLEHAHGTMIAIGEDAFIDEEARFCALRVAAHELFHAWNVWRLRPDAYREPSRTQGSYTDALWLCEGVTRYYEFLLLVRAGLMEPSRFLENMVSFSVHHTVRPAYRHTTLVDSSLATFLNHTRWAGAWNATLDYYDGGMLVAFELDAILRTRFRSSLDVLFSEFYHAYENKPGFDTAAFAAFLEARFPALEGWVARKVRRPATLETLVALQSLGFEVERKPRARLGFLLEPKGSLVVAQVLEGSPAYEAGLAPGDELTAIDGYRASLKALAWARQRAQPFRVSARRGHRFYALDLRARYVDELLALRMVGPLSEAARDLLGPKSESWTDGRTISIAHYDNFHGTEPIH